MTIIEKNGKTLAKHIKQNDIKEGLSFFSDDEESLQVGTWVYNSGKELQAHIHNIVERKISRTNEVLYVINGAVEAQIYDLNGQPVQSFIVNQGEILILLECGHGYKILEENTVVLEVKNGPYPGAEVDRFRI